MDLLRSPRSFKNLSLETKLLELVDIFTSELEIVFTSANFGRQHLVCVLFTRVVKDSAMAHSFHLET